MPKWQPVWRWGMETGAHPVTHQHSIHPISRPCLAAGPLTTLGANWISPAAERIHGSARSTSPWQLSTCNSGEQRSPPPPPGLCRVHVFPSHLPLSFPLMFMDSLSIHMKALVLNNVEVLPSTWHSHSRIGSASLELFKYHLFIIIKRGDLLPGALCWHLWIPKKAKYFDFLLLPHPSPHLPWDYNSVALLLIKKILWKENIELSWYIVCWAEREMDE